MLILSAFCVMPSNVSSEIMKPNCDVKRIALNILNGSSEKVAVGSNGVLITPFFKSFIPLNGSKKDPLEFPLREIANAFMVKSLLF